jgi:3-oxoacyl-[acyl-carrier-protein] synthase II
MRLRRVVVTGLGAVTPIGNTLPLYWDALANGVSGADSISRFDASLFKTRFACEVKNFDPQVAIDKKEARRLDLFSQFALVSAHEAIQDAQFNLDALNKDRVGVIWASGIGGLTSLSHEIMDFARGDGTPRFGVFMIPQMIADIAAGHISMKYGFRGLNYCTVSACASSSHALINALDSIRLGRADVIVTGGSEAAVNETAIGGFSSMKALSSRNDSPQTASRPFDKDRDGFVLGEGAGAIILEEYEHALRRGAKIYCEVAGGGMSADAYHLTAPHPEGLGVQLVMNNTLADAHLTPADIDYINVHGTSTPLGDIAEVKGILNVFGSHAYQLNISSTKSMTGHLLGAAGAIEALASIFAVYKGIVPPTINHENIDPELDNKLNFTFNTAQRRKVRAAMSNTFGFGGHNASVIFKEMAD